MNELRKRKSGGPKVARTETVTVRFDPKLRYLAELAARKQRRTLSSYIEWAISENIQIVELTPGMTAASAATELWDIDPMERLKRLAKVCPHLLTYDEEQSLQGEKN